MTPQYCCILPLAVTLSAVFIGALCWLLGGWEEANDGDGDYRRTR